MNSRALLEEGPEMEQNRHLSLAKGRKVEKDELIEEYEKKRRDLEDLAQQEYEIKGNMVSGKLLDRSKELDDLGNVIMDSYKAD
jgi:hypothetical protein